MREHKVTSHLRQSGEHRVGRLPLASTVSAPQTAKRTAAGDAIAGPHTEPAVNAVPSEHSNEQLTEARARLANYEAQTRQLFKMLAEAQAQLRVKHEIIQWIVNSRSWRITGWLRRLNFLSLRMRPELRAGERHAFHGALDSPEEGRTVTKYLEVRGWAYSAGARIVRVEAFLDTISLGALRYGRPRLDVAAYPSQVPVNCGYEGVLLVDESFVGRRTLTVRVTDAQGFVADYDRPV